MKDLVLKIKSYHQDETFLTLKVPNDLTNEQIIELAKKALAMVDEWHGMAGLTELYPKRHDIHTPNIIRFENAEGAFAYDYYLYLVNSLHSI